MSTLFQFLLILLMVLLGSTKATLQSAMGKRYIRSVQDSVLFNFLFFLAISLWVLLLFGIGEITLPLVLWSGSQAIFTALYQLLYSLALSVGPVSLTVVITNCATFISTFACVMLLDEQLYLPQLIAIAFLAASMVLSMKKSANDKQVSGKWFAFSLTAMIASGIGSTLLKLFSVQYSTASNGDTANTFLFLMYVIGAVFLLLWYIFAACLEKKPKNTGGFRMGMLPFALSMGLALCLFQKVNVYGQALIDGAFLFPTLSGLSSVFMSLIGIFFFHDRLNTKQKLGILCGILSVVLMNLRYLPLW